MRPSRIAWSAKSSRSCRLTVTKSVCMISETGRLAESMGTPGAQRCREHAAVAGAKRGRRARFGPRTEGPTEATRPRGCGIRTSLTG